MTSYSLQQFINETKQDDKKADYFQLETERVLEINLDGPHTQV